MESKDPSNGTKEMVCSKKPHASVIIPSYNSRDTIARCLESLLAQPCRSAFEIIVVDSSDDDTAIIVSERFPQVRLISQKERVLSGRARNIGVEAALGDILLFIDSDCMAEESWIHKMLAAHAAGDHWAVAGSVLNGNPESAVSWASYVTEFSEYMPVGGIRPRISGPTCNISYKREVFERNGGFDENLRMYVDYEFNSRMKAVGGSLLFAPDIRVRHWHRTSLREYAKHEIQRGRAALMLRGSGLLPGAWVTKSRALCALAAPSVLLRHIVADMRRFTFAGMVSIVRLMTLAPYFAAGSLCWGLGFLLEGLVPEGKAYSPKWPVERRISNPNE